MKKLNIESYLGLFLIAFAISPLSYMLNLKFGFRNNIVEPYFLMGLFFLSKAQLLHKIFIEWITGQKFSLLLLLLTVMFFIGLLRTDGEAAEVYADFRCNVIVLYAFFLFQQPLLFQWKDGHIAKSLLWVSILMDLTYSILYFQGVLSGANESIRIRLVCITNCVVLLFLYLSKWNSLNKAFVILLIMTYHTIVSAMRNFYIVFIVTLLVFVLYIVKEKGYILQKLVIVGMLVAAPILYWESVMDFWMSDGSRAVHSVKRVEETFSGENTEPERMESLLFPITDAEYYIIPHGFGWRGFISEIQRHYRGKSILSSMDSQYYYLFFHYGSLLAILIIVYIYTQILANIRRYQKLRIILGAMSAMYVVEFFTHAAIFANLSFAFYYGILLSLLISPNKNIVDKVMKDSFDERNKLRSSKRCVH